jgi:hypothetical protein
MNNSPFNKIKIIRIFVVILSRQLASQPFPDHDTDMHSRARLSHTLQRVTFYLPYSVSVAASFKFKRLLEKQIYEPFIISLFRRRFRQSIGRWNSKVFDFYQQPQPMPKKERPRLQWLSVAVLIIAPMLNPYRQRLSVSCILSRKGFHFLIN